VILPQLGQSMQIPIPGRLGILSIGLRQQHGDEADKRYAAGA
jgi:hypothetical protein